jgi:ectoine hydroxylase-related dioxygenase (phytanoyl-CoA dioxygenase family)
LQPGPEASLTDILPSRQTFRRLLGDPGIGRDPMVDRHLDDPVTYKLCTAPEIVERVAALLGPDILLWHTRYFDKINDATPIPWHQDAPFWSMEPRHCVSAWVALDDIHQGNGCVYVIPGSSDTPLPRVASQGTGRFHKKSDTSGVDVRTAVSMELKRGEFFLFHQWLLHCSGRNPDSLPRLAISIQFIPPEVKLGLERLQDRLPGYGVLQVRGSDLLGLNPHAKAPQG